MRSSDLLLKQTNDFQQCVQKFHDWRDSKLLQSTFEINDFSSSCCLVSISQSSWLATMTADQKGQFSISCPQASTPLDSCSCILYIWGKVFTGECQIPFPYFFYIAMLWQIFPSWHFALFIIANSCASKYLNRSIRCHKSSLVKSIKWRAASV